MLKCAASGVYAVQRRRCWLTGLCGLEADLVPVLSRLHQRCCEIRGTQEVQALFPDARLALEKDWCTEYLDAIISVKLVDGFDEAIDHIIRYSSRHTEAVIAQDVQMVEKFFNHIDSAILLHNASTQFADGGEFGFGAEIGIATGRMHARGPIGVEQLTSFKYRVRGNGQIRP